MSVTYADKPWIKSYKLGPYKLEQSLAPYPLVPVHKALDDAVANYPGQVAVLFMGRTLRYAQLHSLAEKLAAALVRLGVKSGDRVCVFLPNCIEFVISDWGISKAGAAIVPTSVLRSEEGLLHELKSSGSRFIICREEHLEKVLAVRAQYALEGIILTSTEGYDVRELSGTLPPGVHEFRKLLEVEAPSHLSVEIDPAQDLCELSFTGGATGVPKGVMVTHYNRYSCLLQGFPWALKPILRGFVGKASVLIPVPLFHSYGHFTLQMATFLGLRVILLPDPRDTDLLVQTIREYRPLMISLVPTQIMRIAEANLSRLNSLMLSGSAPLPVETAEAVKKKTGMPVSEGYGLTETSPATHYNISAYAKIFGFMAKEKTGIGIPSPDTECKLVDPETGVEAPFGEPGELLLRGPEVMKGYWPTPGSGLTPDGWLRTGDIATMDEDGYFQVVDRIKDMVNVSGMKVYTTNIDEVLYRHPGVLVAAAFGVPDPKYPGSERVMAVIQLKEEFIGKVTEEELRDFCRQHLAPYAVPKFVEFREQLPLTVTEKIFKKELRDEAIARMKEKEEKI